jgi:hypothetical protein
MKQTPLITLTKVPEQLVVQTQLVHLSISKKTRQLPLYRRYFPPIVRKQRLRNGIFESTTTGIQRRDVACAKIEEHCESRRGKSGVYTALSTGDVISAIRYFSNLPQIDGGSSAIASKGIAVAVLNDTAT